MRESKFLKEKDNSKIIALAETATSFDPDGYREEFIRLVEAAK